MLDHYDKYNCLLSYYLYVYLIYVVHTSISYCIFCIACVSVFITACDVVLEGPLQIITCTKWPTLSK